jgi:predicted dehydrogenase
MSSNPVRVASLGMGWWSDVLADAAGRTPDIEIVKCFTRSEDKRNAFAEKYNCQAMASYGEILEGTTARAPYDARARIVSSVPALVDTPIC